ncbi:MAG: Lrp/AsnC ligand binding domain-containing protein [Aigarchaeota archaeon]|nr:Lrp/AsnC ligand binding domain-containing protein [Aigarchaeota archaeon]MCX8192948.1 Lrp/AsnC ligand binding domain-containing protein [Nitrososphaeria archaeon]MDW7986407.1 Lrp/AsnC ligand binding domain-containing protein [Nitrososphaerota archaeon]
MPRGVLAIIHVFVDSSKLEYVAEEINKLEEALDVYEVTGEFDIIAIMKSDDIIGFRKLLKDKILKIEGVKSTVTSIILFTHKRDGRPIEE